MLREATGCERSLGPAVLATRHRVQPPRTGRLGSVPPGGSPSGEAFGQLVLPAVFKTDVTE